MKSGTLRAAASGIAGASRQERQGSPWGQVASLEGGASSCARLLHVPREQKPPADASLQVHCIGGRSAGGAVSDRYAELHPAGGRTAEDALASKLDGFRRQHSDLVALIDELSKLLTPETIAAQAGEARKLVSQISGILRMHLAMEDKALYPRIAAHADERLRELSKRYAEEMGGLHASFTSYLARWPTQSSITRDAEGFLHDTAGVLEALRTRISCEETELYPLVDAADGVKGTP